MSRRFRPLCSTLFALSVICLLATAVFAPLTWAKTPYERQDASEGDPGDGVLRPQDTRLTDPTDTVPTALPLLPLLRLPGTDTVLFLVPLSGGPVPVLRWECRRWPGTLARVAAAADSRARRWNDAP